MIKYYTECNGFRGSELFNDIEEAREAARRRTNLTGKQWVVKWVLVR